MGATFLAAVIRSFSCKYSLASITDDAWLSSPPCAHVTNQSMKLLGTGVVGASLKTRPSEIEVSLYTFIDYQSPCTLLFEITFRSSESWASSKNWGLSFHLNHLDLCGTYEAKLQSNFWFCRFNNSCHSFPRNIFGRSIVGYTLNADNRLEKWQYTRQAVQCMQIAWRMHTLIKGLL